MPQYRTDLQPLHFFNSTLSTPAMPQEAHTSTVSKSPPLVMTECWRYSYSSKKGTGVLGIDESTAIDGTNSDALRRFTFTTYHVAGDLTGEIDAR